MSVMYFRTMKLFNTTTGANNSQSYLEKTFEQKGILPKKIKIISIFHWIKLLFSLKLFSSIEVNLIAVDFNNHLYQKIFRIINFFVLRYYFSKNKKVSTIIIDGLIPSTLLSKNFNYITIIRSSPQCLAFSAMDGRRDHLLKVQLANSKAIVCASPDALNNWKAYGHIKTKKTFYLPVPIPEILNVSRKNIGRGLDFYISKKKKLTIFVFGGNIGPRKGLIPLFEELNLLEKSLFEVKVFGSYDSSALDLKNHYSFNIHFLGFQKINFVKPSQSNILRIYPALSECMSRIHLQGLFSGDHSLIYRRGLEPILNKWIGNNLIFDTFEDVSLYIKKCKYEFHNKPVKKSFEKEYQEMFFNGIENIDDYAKNL
jgi:hypothetical protein